MYIDWNCSGLDGWKLPVIVTDDATTQWSTMDLGINDPLQC